MRARLAAVCLLGLGAQASLAQSRLVIDPDRSQVIVTRFLLDGQYAQPVRVAGTLAARLPTQATPTLIVSGMDFTLSNTSGGLPLGGAAQAEVASRGVGLVQAAGSTASASAVAGGPGEWTTGAWGVAMSVSGTSSHSAQAMGCVLLDQAGVPCDATGDFSIVGPVSLASSSTLVSGTGPREVRLSIQSVVPIRSSSAAWGVLRLAGTLVATETAPTCRADFNNDSSVSIDDIFIFLNAWFSTDSRCDVSGDGVVSIDDIFVFLNLWFAGC